MATNTKARSKTRTNREEHITTWTTKCFSNLCFSIRLFRQDLHLLSRIRNRILKHTGRHTNNRTRIPLLCILPLQVHLMAALRNSQKYFRRTSTTQHHLDMIWPHRRQVKSLSLNRTIRLTHSQLCHLCSQRSPITP